jgi:hypothetical protein
MRKLAALHFFDNGTRRIEMIQELMEDEGRTVKSVDQKRREGDVAKLRKIKLVNKRDSAGEFREGLKSEQKC